MEKSIETARMPTFRLFSEAGSHQGSSWPDPRILPPQPLKCWDYGFVPLRPGQTSCKAARQAVPCPAGLCRSSPGVAREASRFSLPFREVEARTADSPWLRVPSQTRCPASEAAPTAERGSHDAAMWQGGQGREGPGLAGGWTARPLSEACGAPGAAGSCARRL